MTPPRHRDRLALLGLALTALAGSTGCPVVQNLSAPGPTLRLSDPRYDRPYLLYVPSHYREDRRWPLLITCHGTKPWDTPALQIKTWKGLAEQKGFLLAAPELVGTHGDFLPPAATQIDRQMQDERAILATVGAIRAARSVDETRVFLTGWSAGGYAVLFTGLRHPDVFRALSVYQGNFDPAYVEPCAPFLDRYQPVQVVFGNVDTLDQSQQCIGWLRKQGFEPEVVERTGWHRRSEEPVFAFFNRVVKEVPWIHVTVSDDPTDELQIRCHVRATFEPKACVWDFGDGHREQGISPVHRYDDPGQYKVQVKLWAGDRRSYLRSVQLRVPRVHIGAGPPEPASEE